MSYVEVSNNDVKAITVDFDSVASLDKAALAIAGRENKRELGGALDGYLTGAIVHETRKLVPSRTGADQAALMGRSDAYISNAAAVAIVAETIVNGKVVDGLGERQATKVALWERNVRQFWSDEFGPGSFSDLLETCKDYLGEEGAPRAAAIVKLYGVFGNVDNFKRIAKGPKVVEDVETDGDETPVDDDDVATAEAMLRNALNVCVSRGMSALEVLAIVNEVVG